MENHNLKTEYGYVAIQMYYKSFYVIIVSCRMIMVKSFAIKDTIMAPNFSLYRTIKGGKKKQVLDACQIQKLLSFSGELKGNYLFNYTD